MLDWSLRTILIAALVVGPYLAVARATGFDRALRFSLRRAGVGPRFVAGVGALWAATVVAVPRVWPPGTGGGGIELYVVGAVALGLGLGLAAYAGHRLPEFLAVVAGDPVDAGEAAGRVAVAGTAVAGAEVVTAPVSGRESVVCETRTEGRIRRPTLSAEFWAATDAAVDAVPFAVADGTGRLRVDPEGTRLVVRGEADVDAGDDRLGAGPGRRADEEPREAVTDGAGGDADPAAAVDPRARRVERRIEPGDDVVVVGRVREDDDGRVVDAGSGTVVVAGPGADPAADVARVVAAGGLLGTGLVCAGGWAMLLAVGAA